MVVLALVACGEDTAGSVSEGGSSSGSSGTGATTGATSTGTPTTGEPGTTTSDATSGGESTTDPTTGTTTSATGSSGDSSTGSTTGMMSGCGDGILDDGEECDGAQLGGQTCGSQGFDGGTLACLDSCTFDTSACVACGDGQKDPGEECDDGNVDAGDGCDGACKLEACDPDGLYTIQGPAVAYSCCQGLVAVNVSAFTLAADGATIASSPSNPVAMTGAATTCPAGKFANQGVIAGGCTETYKLSGSFVDKDTWSGNYELIFTGNQCTCFDGQLGTPCVNQMFAVTAKR